MDTHHDEPIVVMADEVAEGVAEDMLTLEPLSPVHNRDDGRAPAPVPGLYDDPRRDLLRRDGLKKIHALQVCADDIPSPPPPSLFRQLIDAFIGLPPQIFQRP